MRLGTIMTTLALASLPALAQNNGVRNIPVSGLIEEPGSYVLSGELPARLDASLTITANDVWVDLSGHTLTGPGGLRGTGIHIVNASGVRVMNGTLNNYAFGVIVEGSRSVHLENLQIRGEGLAVPAPPPEVGVMIVQSRNVEVVNNSLYNVGLGVFVRGGMSWGNRVAGNTITSGTNGLIGICYNPTPSDPMAPRGDLITGNLITGFGVGVSFAQNAMVNVLKGNTIVYRSMAIDSKNDTNLDMDNTKVEMP